MNLHVAVAKILSSKVQPTNWTNQRKFESDDKSRTRRQGFIPPLLFNPLGRKVILMSTPPHTYLYEHIWNGKRNYCDFIQNDSDQ